VVVPGEAEQVALLALPGKVAAACLTATTFDGYEWLISGPLIDEVTLLGC
jgi:hypothetical protein